MHRIVLLMTAAALAFAEGGPSLPAGPGGSGDSPASAPAPAAGGSPWSILIIFAPLALMMWFMVIRPQRKEEKRRREMVDSTKRGDDVVTIGGVHGVVDAVGEATIDLRIGKGDNALIVTFNKGAISTNLSNERAAKATAK